MFGALFRLFRPSKPAAALLPPLTGAYAHWTGGRAHLMMRGGGSAAGLDGISGTQTSALLAFHSPAALFADCLTEAETDALAAQLEAISRSPWAAAELARLNSQFPAARPNILQAVVQSGQTDSGNPARHFEVQFDLTGSKPGKMIRRGGRMTETDGQCRFGLTDSAEFAAMNPNRTVPVLQDGDLPPLWETGAILRHLANRYAPPDILAC